MHFKKDIYSLTFCILKIEDLMKFWLNSGETLIVKRKQPQIFPSALFTNSNRYL